MLRLWQSVFHYYYYYEAEIHNFLAAYRVHVHAPIYVVALRYHHQKAFRNYFPYLPLS